MVNAKRTSDANPGSLLLPASPDDGWHVHIVATNTANGNVIVDGNGKDIAASVIGVPTTASSINLDANYETVGIKYCSDLGKYVVAYSQGWAGA